MNDASLYELTSQNIKEETMKNQINVTKRNDLRTNVVLTSKIIESFEALEETLRILKLEKTLFMTRMAKKDFADTVLKNLDKNDAN